MIEDRSPGVGSTANVTYFSTILVDIPISPGVTLSFEVYAGFTDGLEAIGYGLLGQTGFFDVRPSEQDLHNSRMRLELHQLVSAAYKSGAAAPPGGNY